MNRTEIGIVIPFYNGQEYLHDCLQSIWQNSVQPKYVVIVENSVKRTDLDVFIKGSIVTVHPIQAKQGYGKACNAGITYLVERGCGIAIILNQDTKLDKYCIENMVRPFSNQRVAVVAPQTYTYDFAAIESFFIKYYLSQSPDLYWDLLNSQKKEVYKMEKVSGACMAVSLKIGSQTGFFDPLFFMYKEDEDFCRRIRSFGYNIVLAPLAKVAHWHSNSDEDNSVKLFTMKFESQLIFLLKNPTRRFGLNLLSSFRYAVNELISQIIYFRPSHFFGVFWADIRIVGKIRRIAKSHSAESKIIKKLHG